MITDQHERLDFSTVPQSKGITKPAYVVLVIGLIGIFAVGGMSVMLSGYGHMWPSTHTMRMPLGDMPKSQ
jgi:hypothetical protein